MADPVQGTAPINAEAQPVAPVVEPQAAPVAPAPTPVVEPAPIAPAAPVAQPTEQPVNSRTQENFEKLLDSNRKLFEANELLRTELQNRNVATQTFAPIQQTPPIQTQQVNPGDFIEVDQTTGEEYVNTVKMRQKLEEINNRALQAEQKIQNYIQKTEQTEAEKQNKETFTAYPELNPQGEQFDLAFHKQVRAVIYDSYVNPQDYGGRPLQFKEAADMAKQQYQTPSVNNMNGTNATVQNGVQPVEAVPVQNAQQAAEAQALRDQASLSATSQPSQVQPQASSQEDLNALQRRTRAGDDQALALRLSKTDHIRSRDSDESS